MTSQTAHWWTGYDISFELEILAVGFFSIEMGKQFFTQLF